MISFLINAIKIVFILGFLVFIHESGHFLVAKLCKVKVNEFAIGFGPTIWKKQGKETKYALRLIPLGGFVSMEGEEERSEKEGSFSKASIPKRIAIVLAGGVVNIIFALIVYFTLTAFTGNNISNIVDSTIPNYSAEAYGIQAGDKIISVDKESIAGVGMNTSRIMKLLRGPRKSKVLLEIVRRGVEDTLYFTVERDKIPVETIDASYLLTAQTGYIRLNQFGKNSAKEFETALRHLKNQKIENLVLDLRGNSGGFLDAAIDIANHFLQGKQRIVYAKGNKVDIGSFYAKGNGLFQEGKLIVLVDEFSASASEILAGAIQDWDRGIIVGRRSFGKGLVQRPIDLFDGSMIRLTIARYYTPSGRSIQKPYDKGESNRKNYGEDILHRLERGEHISKDSIQLVDSLKYKTLTLSRTVYGGGGVMPDVFVPVDTTHVSSFFKYALSKGLLIQVSLEFVEQEGSLIRDKYSEDEFIQQFKTPESLFRRVQELAIENKFSFEQSEVDQSKSFLNTYLKALIARDIWSTEVFFRVFNQSDPILLKALEILESNKYNEIFKSSLN